MVAAEGRVPNHETRRIRHTNGQEINAEHATPRANAGSRVSLVAKLYHGPSISQLYTNYVVSKPAHPIPNADSIQNRKIPPLKRLTYLLSSQNPPPRVEFPRILPSLCQSHTTHKSHLYK
jgi:hypothetical protein